MRRDQRSERRASTEIPETGKRIGFVNLGQLFGQLMDGTERNSIWIGFERRYFDDD